MLVFPSNSLKMYSYTPHIYFLPFFPPPSSPAHRNWVLWEPLCSSVPKACPFPCPIKLGPSPDASWCSAIHDEGAAVVGQEASLSSVPFPEAGLPSAEEDWESFNEWFNHCYKVILNWADGWQDAWPPILVLYHPWLLHQGRELPRPPQLTPSIRSR